MELEEAVNKLKACDKSHRRAYVGKIDGTAFYVGDFVDSGVKEAIPIVLQELENLQKENKLARKTLIENSNIADERNDLLVEIQKLKKENEQYISGELMTRNQTKHFEEINKKYYIHKDKIKDCLEDIEDYFENVSVPKEDIEFIKEKRKDLLKEE